MHVNKLWSLISSSANALSIGLGSPVKNRFFHRNLANWALWEREFKKKENGGKMSSIGKNIRELCLVYKCLCCMFVYINSMYAIFL